MTHWAGSAEPLAGEEFIPPSFPVGNTWGCSYLCLCAIVITAPLPRTQTLENLRSGHVSPPEHTAAVFPGSVIEEDQKKNP